MNAKLQSAIVYARFSPRPGAAECESVEQQLDELRAYCVQHGHTVAGEFSDKALTGGSDWDSRPGMLAATVAAGKGMLFLVRAYDRLFRDVDKATMFRAMLEAKGVEVRSISEPGANGESMNAKLIRFVFLWIAEYQREITRARTKARMLEHQRNGRRMSHDPPYGTIVDPDANARLLDDAGERATIEIIKQEWQNGQGLRAIARHLAALGVFNRVGGTWHHSQIKRILEREGLLSRQTTS